MSAEPRIISPGEFFLYFQNSEISVNQDTISYTLDVPISFAPGNRWKVALAEMSSKLEYYRNSILCLDIVRGFPIDGKEVRVLSLLPDGDDGWTRWDSIQSATPFYVSLEYEYVGQPIKEIKFQMKRINGGSVSDILFEPDTKISGWLHFKCE